MLRRVGRCNSIDVVDGVISSITFNKETVLADWRYPYQEL